CRGISYEKADQTTWVIRTEFIGERHFLNTIEFVGRRIGGTFATAASCLLVPIGFPAKIIHLGARSVSQAIASTSGFQKINKIWNDEALFGHFITSAPSKCARFAAEPLNWHLRADGTNRQALIIHCDHA